MMKMNKTSWTYITYFSVHGVQLVSSYCMSKKSWPIFSSNLPYKTSWTYSIDIWMELLFFYALKSYRNVKKISRNIVSVSWKIMSIIKIIFNLVHLLIQSFVSICQTKVLVLAVDCVFLHNIWCVQQ